MTPNTKPTKDIYIDTEPGKTTEKFKHAQVYQKRYWDEQWKNKSHRLKQAEQNWSRFIELLKTRGYIKPEARILDVGCGPCGMINFIDTGQRYGLDTLIDYYISSFPMPTEINWIKGFGESLPLRDRQFDLVITTDTLDHAENPTFILKELARIIKNGGVMFLTVNTYNQGTNLIKSIHKKIGIDSPAELHSFTFNQIKKLVESSGFKIVNSWHDKMDLEITTRTSTYKVSAFKNNLDKAKKIREKDGLKESIKFMFAFLSGGRVYQGDSIFIATKP